MNNVCDLGILPQFSKQVLASLTKKIKEGKHHFKNDPSFTAETDVSMVLHLCCASEIRPV